MKICDFCKKNVDKTYTAKRCEMIKKMPTTTFYIYEKRYKCTDYEICKECLDYERSKKTFEMD